MTLEELRHARKHDWIPEGGCALQPECGPLMDEVFDLAEAMLLLEEMGANVSIHGNFLLALAASPHRNEWVLKGRKPTHDVAEWSAQAAIRAAYEEWKK